MSRNLIPLLLNLAHLLANPVTDSTAEVRLNLTEATTSPEFKSSTNAELLRSSLLATANSRFKTQGTLTTASAVLTNLDKQSQAKSRQPGGDIPVSLTTSEGLSTVKTQEGEANQLHGNAVDNEDGSAQVNKTIMSDADIQGNNQMSFNKNTTISNTSTKGGHSTPPNSKGDCKSLSCHTSKLVCFITLWLLGVTAAVFLGLTICLWVRLSIQQAKRVSSETATEVDMENLWAADNSTVEERVEFWYTSGSAIGQDGGGGQATRTEHRNGGRDGRREERDEKLWAQPKVTMKDITDFWYSNGRRGPQDHINQ